ncbi:MAG: hypothetical protein Q8862_07905 [Bacteroidota bacterium]|nr:hypothetical protein [Bacteroidota bacterium]MDP4205514.1 hypothetical protein [Bacteroidota bacterium]
MQAIILKIFSGKYGFAYLNFVDRKHVVVHERIMRHPGLEPPSVILKNTLDFLRDEEVIKPRRFRFNSNPMLNELKDIESLIRLQGFPIYLNTESYNGNHMVIIGYNKQFETQYCRELYFFVDDYFVEYIAYFQSLPSRSTLNQIKSKLFPKINAELLSKDKFSILDIDKYTVQYDERLFDFCIRQISPEQMKYMKQFSESVNIPLDIPVEEKDNLLILKN